MHCRGLRYRPRNLNQCSTTALSAVAALPDGIASGLVPREQRSGLAASHLRDCGIHDPGATASFAPWIGILAVGRSEDRPHSNSRQPGLVAVCHPGRPVSGLALGCERTAAEHVSHQILGATLRQRSTPQAWQACSGMAWPDFAHPPARLSTTVLTQPRRWISRRMTNNLPTGSSPHGRGVDSWPLRVNTIHGWTLPVECLEELGLGLGILPVDYRGRT